MLPNAGPITLIATSRLVEYLIAKKDLVKTGSFSEADSCG